MSVCTSVLLVKRQQDTQQNNFRIELKLEKKAYNVSSGQTDRHTYTVKERDIGKAGQEVPFDVRKCSMYFSK